MIKVYTVLACMLSFTAICVTVVVREGTIRQYIKERGWICFAFTGGVMASMFL